jgi:divalent metal cation (Fe/Co/Zn/Cd) transporter
MTAVAPQGAAVPVAGEERSRWERRAQLLALTSVCYNVAEAVVAVWAGTVAGSGALVAFGLDSVIEVSSGLVILWQFRHALPVTRERAALRMIAVSFFALGMYVAADSARTLLGTSDPGVSPAGIGLAAVSLLVMPWLSWAQRRAGRALSSGSVVADSTQTLLCTYLSAVLLAGLVLNAVLGWAWADPLAGLVIAAVAVREGIQCWRGDNCCPTVGEQVPADGGAAQTKDHSGCSCCGSRGPEPAGHVTHELGAHPGSRPATRG